MQSKEFRRRFYKMADRTKIPLIEQKVADDFVKRISEAQRLVGPNIPLENEWAKIEEKDWAYNLGVIFLSESAGANIAFSRLGALVGYSLINGQFGLLHEEIPRVNKEDIVSVFDWIAEGQERHSGDTIRPLEESWQIITNENRIYAGLSDYFATALGAELRQTRYGALIGYKMLEFRIKNATK